MPNKDRFPTLKAAQNAFRRERIHAPLGYWRGLCTWLFMEQEMQPTAKPRTRLQTYENTF